VKIIVIGSGIAGIASAIRLRARGHDVTVLEANLYPGGKLTSIEAKGYRFDAGPSLFTMPELITDLFSLAGVEARSSFQYRKKEIACHYFYPDGTFLRAYAEPQALAAEIERAFSVPGIRVSRYLEHAARIYDCAGRLFLERPLNAWDTWVSPLTLKALMRLPEFELFSTLHESNVRRLGDPRLVQYFDRMATYNGSSPYRAPAILSMIPHLEHNVGTYLPVGGMISITRSLFALAQQLGVRFEFGCKATRIAIEDRRVSAVETHQGASRCDLVVCNMDVVGAYRELLPQLIAPKSLASQERSSSALIFYWGMRRQFPMLELHNVFFASNYEDEFAAIFERGEIAADPTVYIAITAKDVPADAPPGCENWFVMVNAPANCNQDWPGMTARLRQAIINKLEQHLGVPIADAIEVEEILDPPRIEQRTSSSQGALYGASSNSKWSAFLRHPNQSTNADGLYFCGGSVHPGGGIPLCLQSARIVSEQILERYGE
jgi:phytoene desaturase